MIKITTVLKGEDGRPEGGVNFYWTPGDATVLYQSWEHRASGRDWLEMTPDPMWGNDLVEYVKQCWSELEIVKVIEDYR